MATESLAGILRRSNYLEETTETFNRLTDQDWTIGLGAVTPMPWLDGLVAN